MRPDTYIGSVNMEKQFTYAFDEETRRMVPRDLQFVPGLFKIFDEILVNAADNKQRDPHMDELRVDIDPTQVRRRSADCRQMAV